MFYTARPEYSESTEAPRCQIYWRRCYLHLYKDEIFTVAATPPIGGVNTVFSNQLGIAVLSENWIMPDKLSIYLFQISVV